MTKIKHKIALPFITMIILLPLITLIIFNIVINIYMIRIGKKELASAIETTNYLVRQQVINNVNSSKGEEEIISAIPELTSVLKTSKLATEAEIVIFGRQGRLLYPKNFQKASILNDNILKELKNIDFSNKQVKVLKVDNKRMLVARNNTKQTNFKLIYVLSLDKAKALIKTINFILIIIMAIATFIALIVAIIVSEDISKPIKEISLVANNIGKRQFVSITPNDTSEEVSELYKSINNMSNNLKQAENAQKIFLQNASHELRTPLMSIQGYAEGIMNGVFDDNNSAAKIITDETKRLTTLVEQLLILSRIENKTYHLNLIRVDLGDLMKDYIQRINGLAMKCTKQIKYKSPNIDLSINVDEELLSQAVMNIAANGIRHAKFIIEIEIISQLEFVQIIIRDDGEGISKEDLPHVFERFYKGRDGNTGLGLSIAKSAIDFSGGELKAQNWENGAEFIISLPK